MLKPRFLLPLLLPILLLGCKKENTDIDFGYAYFPMEEGSYVLYNVQEIFHDKGLNPQHDTVRYQLKRAIGEEVLDNEGRKARKFFLTKYDGETGDVLDERVWTRIIADGKGEVVEENQRKIRMIFAVKQDKEWDVNAFNMQGTQKVYFKNVDDARTINGKHFDQTATIQYDDFFSLVDYRKSHEVYAKGVGLVERSFKDLTINNFDTLDINKGTELHYQLVDFGKK